MKNRTRYIAAILGAVGIAVAVAGCGHGYRHHESGDYAARHIEKLGKELNLNEAQTAKLNAVTETLRKGRDSLRAKHDEKHKEMLALLDQPKLDRQRALGMVQQTTRGINEHAPEMIAANLADIRPAEIKPAERPEQKLHADKNAQITMRFADVEFVIAFFHLFNQAANGSRTVCL